MKAIGYVRVSTDQQADRGVSLEAQAAKIRAMAVVQGAELVDIVVDGGESAKTMKRPGLQRILSLVEAGRVQAVIVVKLDRLTRSVRDLCSLLEMFEKRRVALISVGESLNTGTAAGRLVITILGALAEWEAQTIAERTKAALQHKIQNGERAGNLRYGLRLAANDRHVEESPEEQVVLAEIGRLRSEGYSMRRIAADLNHRGYRTRRGTEWRLESVARVLNAKQLPNDAISRCSTTPQG